MEMPRVRLFVLFYVAVSAGCTHSRALSTSELMSSSEARMDGNVYTLGEWRVRSGREAEFVAAWEELGAVFAELTNPPAGRGTLIQSLGDPALFYSFGPWSRLEDVEAMRENAQAQEAIRRLLALCTDASPGTFRVVAESP